MKDPLLLIAILSASFYVFGYFRLPFVYAGLALQLAYLFLRGLDLERLPLVGPHDTLFFLSASIVLFAMPVASKMKDRQKFLYSVIAMSVFFIFISLLYRPHDSPLPPVLRTFWFETHVAFSFFSYALFGIAAILGILYLLNERNRYLSENSSSRPFAEVGAGGLQLIESLQYKTILVGYFLFSAAMVFGGIWAYLAWGTYWLWTPKELWTVILWLFYSLYLHTRLRHWWQGKPSVLLGVIGFGIVMFTYLGVSLLMKSSHAF
ncbi:MAG: cytochrome c biogenesis protein CcsA [Nitrospirota bacterium]